MSLEEKMISVIVPIYNVEPYLEQCLKSIISQTYKKLEIILVDDGSEDNCAAICDHYKDLDSRIIVIHKKNGGLSDARNAGLEVASGDIISFIDSDDFISDNMYTIMMRYMSKCKADIVECYYTPFEDGCTPRADLSSEYEIYRPYEWLTETNLKKRKMSPVVAWNKLYKKSLFDNIRYPVGRIHEDEATTYKLIYNAKIITRISAHLYFYRQRPGSITASKKMDLKHFNAEYQAYSERFEYFQKKHERNLAYFSLSKLGILIASNYQLIAKDRTDIKRLISSNFSGLMLCKAVPLKHKVYLAAFLIAPNLVSKYKI